MVMFIESEFEIVYSLNIMQMLNCLTLIFKNLQDGSHIL